MRPVHFCWFAASLVACGGGGDGGPQPQPSVASVVVTPSATSTTLCSQVTLSAQPRDAQGNNLTRDVSWEVSATSVLSPAATSGASITATGVGVGSSTVTARSETVGSTPLTITVSGAGQPAQSANVAATANNAFTPGCVVIAAGGAVTWTFASTHNVIFGSNQPSGGNIPETPSGSVSRTFPAAGNYPYTCNIHPGMSGRVVVQ